MVETVRLKGGSLRALDPTSGPIEVPAGGRSAANRSRSLDGAVLAIVDNGFNPNFGRAVIDALRASYKLGDVIHVVKDNVSVPPRPADWERIKARATAGIALYGG